MLLRLLPGVFDSRPDKLVMDLRLSQLNLLLFRFESVGVGPEARFLETSSSVDPFSSMVEFKSGEAWPLAVWLWSKMREDSTPAMKK